jgi:hypothetical protein
MLRFTAALAALALLGAGCGKSEQDEYADGLKPVNQHLNAFVRDVSRSVTGASTKTDEQLARQFGGLGDRAGVLRKQLDDLDPPDDVRTEQKTLVTALRKSEHALHAVQKAASQHKASEAGAATLAIATTTLAVEGARRQLTREVRR